jgi:hypothetical protein
MRRADRADSAESRALVGRELRKLPLARCPPDRGFAYDSVLFLFSLVDLEFTVFNCKELKIYIHITTEFSFE